MLCPLCQVDLVMSDRKGIEIDYCPKCRGVWLDRGELDKIIERSAADEMSRSAPPVSSPTHSPVQPAQTHQQSHYGSGHHKKKSVWGDIFDFD